MSSPRSPPRCSATCSSRFAERARSTFAGRQATVRPVSSREPLPPAGSADPDDWFGEASSPRPAADDWLDEPPVARWPTRSVGRFDLDWRIVLAALAAVAVLVVAGLAIGGVFSGGSKNTTTSTQSTPTTNRTPTTTPKAPATIAAPSGPLSPGANGAQVKVLQRALKALGYPVGKVDGDYGPATQTALKQFQTKNHLTADGVLGPKTLQALKQALKKT